MVDYRISDLTAASAPTGAEVYEIVQGGYSRKLTLTATLTWLTPAINALIAAATPPDTVISAAMLPVVSALTLEEARAEFDVPSNTQAIAYALVFGG